MSVCQNQDTFNKSFHEAIKYVEKKNEPRKWVQVVVFLLLVVLITWALLLSMKVSPSQRTLHIVLALVFSPVYIIAHYLNQE